MWGRPINSNSGEKVGFGAHPHRVSPGGPHRGEKVEAPSPPIGPRQGAHSRNTKQKPNTNSDKPLVHLTQLYAVDPKLAKQFVEIEFPIIFTFKTSTFPLRANVFFVSIDFGAQKSHTDCCTDV